MGAKTGLWRVRAKASVVYEGDGGWIVRAARVCLSQNGLGGLYLGVLVSLR